MSLLLAIAVVSLTTFFNPSPTSTAIEACSLTPHSQTPSTHCPPFTSLPSFPFSSSPGCGHPSFQIKCANPFSTISINDLSFSVVRYEPNTSSLTLSPKPSDLTNCSHSPSIPRRPINLTGTPFRVADASCSRLTFLRPCSTHSLPNCSHCTWECKLAKSPLHLLRGYCGTVRNRGSGEACENDVLGFLDGFLRIGIQFEWDEAQDLYFSKCIDCRANNGVCGFNSSDPEKRFVCFRSRSRFSPPWIGGDNPKRIAILSAVFVLACLLLFSLIGVAIFRSKRFGFNSSAIEDPATLFLHRHRSASLLPPEFSYEELEAATNGFDPKRKIGDGGFGSVYLGRLCDGKFVAVKYLHRQNRHGRAFSSKSFCNEVLILSSIDHPNLVKLHGYCSDTRGLILVYDYVPNGTLADHIHGPKFSRHSGALMWPVRVNVALQTAMAMEYLHFAGDTPIVHRDITSANIFVEKDMTIKVGDFGLSRLLVFAEESADRMTGCVWTGPQGTPGYLDPDYHRSFRLTEKSDVYSFGVVLFELITGLRAVDQSRDKREISLADLVVSKIHMGLLHQVVDPALMTTDGSDRAVDGVEAVAELAFRCVAADKDDRPDAREIVQELRMIRSRTRGGSGGGAVTRASSMSSVGGTGSGCDVAMG